MINTLGVCFAVLLPGIHARSWQDLLLASLLLGFLNSFVRPLLVVVALPLLIFSLGLFMLVINAFLLLLVGKAVPGFVVDGFGWAVLGSLIIGAVSLVLGGLTGAGKVRVQSRRFGRPQNRPDHRDDGGGPVIDV